MIIYNKDKIRFFPEGVDRRAPSYLYYDENTLIGSFDIYGDEVWNFIILAPYRSMGYGTKMMKELQETLGSKKPNLRLWVEARNKPAMKLYTRAGFETVEETISWGRTVYTMLWRNRDYVRRY